MKHEFLKPILLATAALAAPMCFSGAQAQASATQSYDIPAQPLGDALLRLGQISGRNILFDAGIVKARTSVALHGAPDFESALRTLIGKANISYSIRADGTVVIQQGKARTASATRSAAANLDTDADDGRTTILVEGRRLKGAEKLEFNSNTTVNVLSAEEIASHPDRNVAETLARVPGINVMYSTASQAGPQGNGTNYGGLDTAARGEGQFVSVRAMNGEYNVNLINGIDVAQGMPYSREVQLSLLPPTGINNIVVSKVSTADMQGDAIGGTIDFRMPSALENPGTHVSLYASSQYESRAADYGLNPWGYQGQLAVSKTFGPDNRFGVYLSGYYSMRRFANSQQTYQSGMIEYNIVDAQKQSPAGIAPEDNLQLMSVNMQFTRGQTERYGAVGGIDWEISDNVRAFVRGTYARSDTEQTVYQLGAQGDRKDLGGFAVGVPIDSTGGSDGLMQVVSKNSELHYWAESNPGHDELGTAVAGIEAKLGKLTVTPQVYYSWGANNFPNHFEITFYNRANDPNGNNANPAYQRFNTGLGIGYNGNYPVPVFTSAILQNLANIGSWAARGRGEVTDGKSNQKKTGFKLDFNYDVGSDWLESIKFGGKYSSADRFTAFRDVSTNAAMPAGTTLDGSGFVDTTLDSVIPGIYDYKLPLISAERFWAAYKANGGFNVVWSPDDYNGNTVSGTEKVASGYALANMNFGDLSVVPGIRFEHSEIHNRFWISGNNGVDANGQHYGWSTSDSKFNEFLPSITAAWRPNARSVYRAALWTSYTRPPFIQLAGNTSTRVDADGNVSITRGNPDLKPIKAFNADISSDWTTNFGSFLSVAGFYKHLRDYIYAAGGNFSRIDTDTGGRVTISQPVNGGSGDVYGVELNLRQSFTMLPGVFGGLGVAANATFQNSRVNLKNPYLDKDERMQNAPNRLYNLSLIYDKYGVSGDFSYHYSSDYVATYGLWGTTSFGSPLNGSAFDQWVHARGQFDLSMAYRFTKDIQVRFAVQNLTGTTTYYDTIGRYSTVAPQIIEGGRTFQLSVRAGF